MALLELRHASKSYGTGTRRTSVLRDIRLKIAEQEFIAIVGYSGSGKTTLMSLMAGLIKPDEGEVLLRGRPMPAPGPDRAMVFQNYSLLPWLSVRQNIALAVQAVYPDWSESRRRAHVSEHIERVQLGHAGNRRPHELSGGMRQRVAVARALATDPGILLLDEPLGALDALTRATLQDEIARLWIADRKTVVMVTNDVDEAVYLADRVIPLGVGPGATLGPERVIDIPRPRDRRMLNHDPRFQAARREILQHLISEGAAGRARSNPVEEPSDLEPEAPGFGRMFRFRSGKALGAPATSRPKAS